MATNRVKLEDVINEAKAALEAGNADRVIVLCNHIFKFYPRCLEASRILAEAYTEKQLLDEADQLLAFVLSADPQDVLGYADRGFIAFERNDLDNTIMYYERALELDSSIDKLREELLRLYREKGVLAKIRLTKVGLANARLRDGFYAQAIEEYNSVLRATPNRLDVQVGLMEAYWRNRDYPRAETMAQDLLKDHPDLVKANLILWHIRGVRRHEDSAAQLIEKANALDPLNLIAERLFDQDALTSNDVMNYISMLGVATVPQPPAGGSLAADDAGRVPEWASTNRRGMTDRLLGLTNPPPPEPTSTGDDMGLDIFALLADTEAYVAGSPSEPTAEEKERAEGQDALAQLRSNSAKDADTTFDFFDEIEQTAPKVDLSKNESPAPRPPAFDLDFSKTGDSDFSLFNEVESPKKNESGFGKTAAVAGGAALTGAAGVAAFNLFDDDDNAKDTNATEPPPVFDLNALDTKEESDFDKPPVFDLFADEPSAKDDDFGNLAPASFEPANSDAPSVTAKTPETEFDFTPPPPFDLFADDAKASSDDNEPPMFDLFGDLDEPVIPENAPAPAKFTFDADEEPPVFDLFADDKPGEATAAVAPAKFDLFKDDETANKPAAFDLFDDEPPVAHAANEPLPVFDLAEFGEPNPTEQYDLPDFLRENSADAAPVIPAGSFETPEIAPAPELPDAPEVVSPVRFEQDADLPDFLAGIAETPETPAVARDFTPETGETSAEEFDVPGLPAFSLQSDAKPFNSYDFLSGTPPVSAAPDAPFELPDFLAGDTADAGMPPADAGLPLWLQGLPAPTMDDFVDSDNDFEAAFALPDLAPASVSEPTNSLNIPDFETPGEITRAAFAVDLPPLPDFAASTGTDDNATTIPPLDLPDLSPADTTFGLADLPDLTQIEANERSEFSLPDLPDVPNMEYPPAGQFAVSDLPDFESALAADVALSDLPDLDRANAAFELPDLPDLQTKDTDAAFALPDLPDLAAPDSAFELPDLPPLGEMGTATPPGEPDLPPLPDLSAGTSVEAFELPDLPDLEAQNTDAAFALPDLPDFAATQAATETELPFNLDLPPLPDLEASNNAAVELPDLPDLETANAAFELPDLPDLAANNAAFELPDLPNLPSDSEMAATAPLDLPPLPQFDATPSTDFDFELPDFALASDAKPDTELDLPPLPAFETEAAPDAAFALPDLPELPEEPTPEVAAALPELPNLADATESEQPDIFGTSAAMNQETPELVFELPEMNAMDATSGAAYELPDFLAEPVPLDMPQRADGSFDMPDLPDFLRDVPETEARIATAELPDFLRDTSELKPENVPADALELPDFLQETSPEPEFAVAPELPDFLQEEPQIGAEAAVTPELPDFLRDAPQMEAAAVTPELPDFLADVPAENADYAPGFLMNAPALPGSDDLPDFLREEPSEMSELPTFLPQEAPSPSELPDFLRDTPETASAELPDFLQEVPEDELQAVSDEQPATEPEPDAAEAVTEKSADSEPEQPEVDDFAYEAPAPLGTEKIETVETGVPETEGATAIPEMEAAEVAPTTEIVQSEQTEADAESEAQNDGDNKGIGDWAKAAGAGVVGLAVGVGAAVGGLFKRDKDDDKPKETETERVAATVPRETVIHQMAARPVALESEPSTEAVRYNQQKDLEITATAAPSGVGDDENGFLNYLLEQEAPAPATTATISSSPARYVYYKRDERGTPPDFVLALEAKRTGTGIGGVGADNLTDSSADSLPSSAMPGDENSIAPAPNPRPDLLPQQYQEQENDAMPIKRGPQDDNDVFDWEREELPDYLRAFAMDEDEVARSGLAAPNSTISDVNTGPARIRPRDDTGAPGDLPDWLNPTGTPGKAVRGEQIDLGGSGRPGSGTLPNWLDTPALDAQPTAGRPTPPNAPPPPAAQPGFDMGIGDMDDLQPFSFGTDDGFGGPAPTRPTMSQPAAPSPAPTAPQSFDMGIGDMNDLQPFSFDDPGGFGTPAAPPSRTAQPPAPQPQVRPSQPQLPAAQPPITPGFDMGGMDDFGMDDLQPFSFDDGGATAAPPPARQTPPAPQPRQLPSTPPAPAPQGGFDMGIGDMDDLQPFNFEDNNSPFGTPAAPPSRTAQPPAPQPPVRPSQPPPPVAPTPITPGFDMGGMDDFGMDDLQPFSFDDGGATPTPPPPPAPQPRQIPSAPQQPAAAQPDMPFGIPGGRVVGGSNSGGMAPTPDMPFGFPGAGGEDFVGLAPFQLGEESIFGNNTPKNSGSGLGLSAINPLDTLSDQPFGANAPRARRQPPKVEAEPGQEAPLREFPWMKQRQRQEETEKSDSPLFRKLQQRRQQEMGETEQEQPVFRPQTPAQGGELDFSQFPGFSDEELSKPAPPSPRDRGTTGLTPKTSKSEAFNPMPTDAFNLGDLGLSMGLSDENFNSALDQALPSSGNAGRSSGTQAQELPFSDLDFEPFDLDNIPENMTPGNDSMRVKPPTLSELEPRPHRQPEASQPEEVSDFRFDLNEQPAKFAPAPTPTPAQKPNQDFDFGTPAPDEIPDFNLDFLDDEAPADFGFEFDKTPAPTNGVVDRAPAASVNGDKAAFEFARNEPEIKEPFMPDFSFGIPAHDNGKAPTQSEPSATPDFDFGLPTEPKSGADDMFNLFDESASAPPERTNPPTSKPAPDFSPQPDFNFDLGALSPSKPEVATPDFDFGVPATTPEPPTVPIPIRPTPETAPTVNLRDVRPTTGALSMSNGSPAAKPATGNLNATLQMANEFYEKQDVNQAIIYFNNAVKQAQGAELDSLVNRLREVVGTPGVSPRYHRVLGDAYKKQGQFQAALAEYSKALAPAKR
jgi:tetratricopeptide (TPR) repeat protein